MPLILLKLLISGAIWLSFGLISAIWFYPGTAIGALRILRGYAIFAALTGLIGLILPQILWPWLHFILPTAIFLLFLTALYRFSRPNPSTPQPNA